LGLGQRTGHTQSPGLDYSWVHVIGGGAI